MIKDDNPHVFPFPIFTGEDDQTVHPGMSLRDWFAGQALSTVYDSYPEHQLNIWFGYHASGITREQIKARAAYAQADALLAERGK